MYKKFMIFSFLLFTFTACSNKTSVNPDPESIKGIQIEELSQQKYYEKKGYDRGIKEGFELGLKWAEKAIDRFMNRIHDIQFANYLNKEKYIQSGLLLIDEDNRVHLTKMEIVPPYTKADIFNKFGGEIPRYAKKDLKDMGIDYDTPKRSQYSKKGISPVLYKKKEVAKRDTIHILKDTYVEIYNTQSNIKVLRSNGIEAGINDEKLIATFDTEASARAFCRNFQICVKVDIK